MRCDGTYRCRDSIGSDFFRVKIMSDSGRLNPITGIEDIESVRFVGSSSLMQAKA
jgi:hypothetical protein